MKKILRILGAAAILGATASASALSFDFYKLDKANNPVTDFLPSSPYVTSSNDALGDPLLQYTVDGVVVTATATFNGAAAHAVQDSTKDWDDVHGAGLGVYKTRTPIDLGDDNIDSGEKLILTFNRVVTLTRILLRADGHNITNWADGATFLLNGTSYNLPKNVGYIDGSWTGSVFTFMHSGIGPASETGSEVSHDFYVAGLKVNVPDTGSTIALLGLGLLGLAAASRRKHS
ncbi:VPDSG-CTERM sorting domain-containing protein [Pelagicoccus enzymogenes]|uniref:VPDSG-CTERM sorting domain-containing protein n=1 Tax=Pelagicoccus enzymogenes TaxID=2773457 RepID=UPI00280CECE2|nr:VPDSG-CTERM sorting domain-containing protein [Pelagicoccus enzymogenes]MDQ8200797.1 VPDSG-CTERM sorting domain-containing protein [Pelagicoccus enzymogenes]